MGKLRQIRPATFLTLREAFERYLRFHEGCSMNRAWILHGSKNRYEAAYADGYIVPVGGSLPAAHVECSWTLTDLGVGILQAWIGMQTIDKAWKPICPVENTKYGMPVCGCEPCQTGRRRKL